MKFINIFLHLIFTIILTSCAHSLHLNYTSDFSPTYKNYTEGKIVKARTEQFVVLGITRNTDYVDEAYKKIQNECPNGNLQSVNTQYATALGFFSWTNSIDIKALCIN